MASLMVIVSVSACAAFSVNDLVDIVIAVKQYFRSGCIFLLHDNGNGKFNKYVGHLYHKNLVFNTIS
jgi:hypothetical protein